ncbi:hypothetical protein Tco_0918008 [Tanacetum coccineum]
MGFARDIHALLVYYPCLLRRLLLPYYSLPPNTDSELRQCFIGGADDEEISVLGGIPRVHRTWIRRNSRYALVAPTVTRFNTSTLYITESDTEGGSEEYEDDETEDGPVDYPMDGGDDGDDDDDDSPRDDARMKPVILPPSTDITIGARITVRPQTSISLPPEVEVERLLTISPSPPISLSPPSAGERLARCMAPPAHSPPLPPSPGCLTQIQTLRIASTQALIDAVTATLPPPPLPPLPPSLSVISTRSLLQ